MRNLINLVTYESKRENLFLKLLRKLVTKKTNK